MSWSVRIVCSPRPSVPMTIRQPRSRIDGGAVIANSLANRWRLRSETISATTSTRTPCRRSMRTCDFDRAGGGGEVVDGSRRGRCAPATSCELPAMKLSRSMSSSTPTYSPFSVTATRRLLCLVILQQRARDEIVGVDRDDVVLRQRSATRRLDRQALRGSPPWPGLMPVSRPTRSPSRTNSALDLMARISRRRCSIDSAGVDEDGADGTDDVAHPRAEQRAEARRLLVARHRFELARNVAIEERGEAVVMGDQLEDEVARREVAQRLLARDEGVRSAALDEGAAVETIAGAAQADDFVAVALLDAALDDDEQAVRRAVAARSASRRGGNSRCRAPPRPRRFPAGSAGRTAHWSHRMPSPSFVLPPCSLSPPRSPLAR